MKEGWGSLFLFYFFFVSVVLFYPGSIRPSPSKNTTEIFVCLLILSATKEQTTKHHHCQSITNQFLSPSIFYLLPVHLPPLYLPSSPHLNIFISIFLCNNERYTKWQNVVFKEKCNAKSQPTVHWSIICIHFLYIWHTVITLVNVYFLLHKTHPPTREMCDPETM